MTKEKKEVTEGSREGEEKGGTKKREENEIKDIGWEKRRNTFAHYMILLVKFPRNKKKKKQLLASCRIHDQHKIYLFFYFLVMKNQKIKLENDSIHNNIKKNLGINFKK